MKLEPWPKVLRHSIEPDIARTSFFTIERPKPVEDSPPVGRALRRANFPNIRF